MAHRDHNRTQTQISSNLFTILLALIHQPVLANGGLPQKIQQATKLSF